MHGYRSILMKMSSICMDMGVLNYLYIIKSSLVEAIMHSPGLCATFCCFTVIMQHASMASTPPC